MVKARKPSSGAALAVGHGGGIELLSASPASGEPSPARVGASETPKPAKSTLINESVRQFWARHVCVQVPFEKCKDYLALERTFLAHLRTSLTIATLGTTITQLYRLSSTPSLPTSTNFGFYTLSMPIGILCTIAAMFVALLGAYRFLRQQEALGRGKVHAGGWDVYAIGAMIGVLLMVLFISTLVVVVNPDED